MLTILNLPVSDILNKIGPNQSGHFDVPDPEGGTYSQLVNLASLRLLNFKTNGIKCICCGAEGYEFRLEINHNVTRPTQPHFNLYGTDTNGNDVLMTLDHIIPLSWNGAHTLKNACTMCKTCNESKKNEIPSAKFLEQYGGEANPDGIRKLTAHETKKNKTRGRDKFRVREEKL